MLNQISSRVGHASPRAREADTATLARERDDAVALALRAVHANETVLGDAADEVVTERTLDEERYRVTAPPRVGQEAFEFYRDHLVQD